ncbi:hypothetical protein RM52_07275 [Microbacterium hominis]|uniref:Major facilitator superfamily associated domain-containing protein n=1 Tax=Microbacterium hominis TaxID=162426 RepID=A0A0B4CN24_9MICO|nr:hypothetical protein RM52_07275 [Microbacterium hominis]
MFQSYWGLWMASRGFAPIEIGTAVAGSLVGRAIGVGVLYPWLNRHATLLRLARVLPWLIVAAALPYLFVNGFGMLVAVSIVFGVTYPLLLPLNETIATSAARQGLLQYGPTRSLGSFGFMLGTVAAGWLVSGLGAGVLTGSLIAACLLTAVTGLLPVAASSALEVRGTGISGVGTLIRRRAFVACLVAASIIQGSHAAYYSFGAIRASELVSPVLVPLVLVLAPVSEFVMFASARRRVESVGVRTLLVAGAAIAAGRWAALAVLADGWGFAFSQILHAGSYAATHLAFNMFVRDQIDPSEHAAAQGLYASVAMGLAMAMFTFVAGLVAPAGLGAAFAVMSAVALCGILVAPFVRSTR